MFGSSREWVRSMRLAEESAELISLGVAVGLRRSVVRVLAVRVRSSAGAMVDVLRCREEMREDEVSVIPRPVGLVATPVVDLAGGKEGESG